MKNRLKRCIEIVLLTWICLTTASVHALVLGDIHVHSFLGQPLNAKIAFSDLSDVDASSLKLHLAGMDEYRRLGLQYPESPKFNFQLIEEPGALLPFVRITTPHSLEEPFVNLLVEVSSPAGKLIRAYTFLLDPAPESSPEIETAQESRVAVLPPVKISAKKHRPPAKAVTSRKKHRESAPAGTNRSHLKLAMSLSISSYDPAADSSANRDALQEELIAKEKALEELKLQIGEMHTVIRSLQGKSGIAEPEIPQIASQPQAQIEPQIAPQIAVETKIAPSKARLNLALFITVLLLGLTGFILYRKYKQLHQHSPFDDLHEETLHEAEQPFEAIVEPIRLRSAAADERAIVTESKVPFTFQNESDAGTHIKAAPIAGLHYEKISVGEQSIQTPAYTASVVPPEYAALMEANCHLRAGNDEKAENALLQAIELNPKNLYGYQALLRIYEKRGDLGAFESVALKYKAIADEAAFDEIAEKGRSLDPDNPLYQ